ncbi:DUF3846 domain-containing protein [Anaerotignum sp. MB30-C6]|uniref:DUF3846 domain-containing protein n=1 Tax=Anaerotignum sp. MB30-C6 TaxID=3070814 RepID=UPI0027DEA08E|nr:DUF3846 domain-containing protein [Anaerotignum sp. MB30-C6]WMI82428.1 DUF3846 domain-containing protein [Anaerotignum sp. MB30-C6]
MLKTNAIFERKCSAVQTQPCVIEAVEQMDREKFKEFSNGLLEDRQFIADHKEDMFVDSNGVIHGLLALDMESGDGILIDSSGYDYARYSAFMPNIKPYLDEQIALTADKIIKDGITNAENGRWSFDIDDARNCCKIHIKESNGIGGMLISDLRERQEIGEIVVEGNCFEITLDSEYCNKLKDNEQDLENDEVQEECAMTGNKIKVVKMDVGKPPVIKEIENTLEALQAEVGGLIECVYLDDGCLAVVNEEGKLNGMEPNRRLGSDIICGPFFICGDSDDGEFVSLDDKQVEQYTRMFSDVPAFTGEEPELEPRMTFIGFDF